MSSSKILSFAHLISLQVHRNATGLQNQRCKAIARRKLERWLLYFPKFSELFCKSCEKTINHSRPESLEKHLVIESHKKAKQAKIDRNQVRRRQATLNDAVSAAQLRSDITQDFIAVCTESGIPLNKAEKLIPFMRKHARNGGVHPKDRSNCASVSSSKGLRQTYQRSQAQIGGKGGVLGGRWDDRQPR